MGNYLLIVFLFVNGVNKKDIADVFSAIVYLKFTAIAC